MANFLLTQTGEEVQTILNEAPETKEGLQQEVTNREQAITAEEQARDEAIAAEQQAREQAITAEASARADADAALDAKIDAETSRAETAEQTLADAIAKEVTDRKAAVTAEATAREQADTAQQQALSQETSRAQQAELTNAQAISTEAHARSEADTILQNHIDDEEERAKAAEATLQSNIDVIDQTGGAAVAAEQQARADADAALDAKIDAETTRAETAEQTLTEAIAQEVTDREAAVTAEATAREQADTAQQQALTQETSRAQQAELTNAQAISTEAQARTDADTAQQQALTQETSRAQQAELTNAQAISTEAQARTDADTAILDNLQAEARTRLNADTDLQDHIDDEETRAKAAEQTLQGNIDTETQARQQSDTTLDGKIAGNTQAIATEKTRAEGAEQDLQTAIDAINGKIPAQATAQNQLADKQFVNSSIQTATAEFKGTFNSKGELDQVTANANDYAYVVSKDTEGNTVYSRYKWVDGTGWVFEYNLNNSSFTAAQWAAIQSGITAALVTKLTDLPTNDELNQRISTAITTALGQYYTKTEIDNILTGYVQTGTFNGHTGNTTVHITSEERTAWNAKQNAITDGAQIGLGFGVCDTAVDTAAKVVAIPSFILLKNMPVSIRFTNAINVVGATLNISSTGAKPLFIQGAALQAGLVKGGCTVTVIYDGTNWNIVGIEGLERPASQSDLLVDMGLPSGRLWAVANIDVTKQSGFAEVDGKPSPFIYECTFFSWGNTEGHNPTSTSAFSYDWGTANDGPYASTPGAQLTANAGLSFDAARAILGAPWRDPSTEDFAELFANIDYVQADGETVIDASQANKLVTVNSIVGIYLKSKNNGKLLFFPCSGHGYGSSWNYRGSSGVYWSSSLSSATYGRVLNFYSGGVYPQYTNLRFYGFAGRAVQ